MAGLSLPNFPPFDTHQDGLGTRWKKWLERFNRLLIGLNIKDDNTRKRALLLHYAGPDVDEIFDTLSNTGEENDYDTAVTKLNEYFIPKTCLAYEIYNFRQAKQSDDENLDSYHTRLRTLAKTCEFTDIDREIASQIILHCSSQRLRRRAIRENLGLQELLEAGRALEISETQATKLEATDKPITSDVNYMQKQRSSRSTNNRKWKDTNRKQQENNHQSSFKSNKEDYHPKARKLPVKFKDFAM